MTNNKQKPNPENPNNQFSNSEPMTFAQKVDYIKNINMTNNKQQTAVEWLFNELERIDKVYHRNTIIYTDARKEAYEKAKEMAKEQAIKLHYEYELYVMMNESDVMTFGQFYKQTYGGGKQ